MKRLLNSFENLGIDGGKQKKARVDNEGFKKPKRTPKHNLEMEGFVLNKELYTRDELIDIIDNRDTHVINRLKQYFESEQEQSNTCVRTDEHSNMSVYFSNLLNNEACQIVNS
jgi:hypothetical protein